MSKISINLDSLKPKREWKRHKVKEGANVFRFLPPFGDQANGYPYRKWMVVWGMMDPENGRQRPYASSLTTENKCPIYEYVSALQKIAEAKKGEFQAAGMDDKGIREALKPLNKIISNFRPKTVYAWNAVHRAGTIGLLEVKPTAHQQLKELMSHYIRDYNQDPTSVNSENDDSGVWFNVGRTGQGFDTKYTVEKVQTAQKIQGQMTYIDDRSPLAENIQVNWESMAYDLSSIYQVKTYDELKAILMANMPLILQECSDAAVEGFIPVAGAPQVTAAVAEAKPNTMAEAAPPTQAPVQQAAAPQVAAPKVNLKLDAGTNDAPAQTVTAPNTQPANAADDDFLKMAEDILNE